MYKFIERLSYLHACNSTSVTAKRSDPIYSSILPLCRSSYDPKAQQVPPVLGLMANGDVGDSLDWYTCSLTHLSPFPGEADHLEDRMIKDLECLIDRESTGFGVEEDNENPANEADSRVEAESTGRRERVTMVIKVEPRI